MSQTINFVEILNPLDPRDRSIGTLEWSATKSVAEYLPLPIDTKNFVIALNGHILSEKELALSFPAPNDYLVICPNVLGGDGGGAKGVLRIAALIALAVYAPTLGAQFSYALGGGEILGSVAGLNALSSAVLVVGGAVVNAVLPPPKPKQSESSTSESPSFGIDGPKNTSAQGICVPIVYGEIRYGGNVIHNYTTNDSNTQYLHMLFNLGEGPVDLITDIQVNGQSAIGTYAETFRQATRNGDAVQSVIPWFADNLVTYPVGQELTTSYYNYLSHTEVDRLRLDFVAPIGIFDNDGGGGLHTQIVPIMIQYRKQGDTTWLPFPSDDEFAVRSYTETTTWRTDWYYQNSAGKMVYGTYVPDGTEFRPRLADGSLADYWVIYKSNDGFRGLTTVTVGTITKTYGEGTGEFRISAATRTTFRFSINSTPLPAEAIYEIQVKRVNPPETGGQNYNEGLGEIIQLSGVTEIVNEDVTYPNTALAAIRIKMNEQISSIPTVTFLVRGKKVRVWQEQDQQWLFTWTDNPAWIALDILTNKRYGGACPLSRIDLIRWKEWARFCDTTGLKFNGVFDSTTNVWDALQSVLIVGRAQIVRFGTRYTVIMERAETPSMMFTMGNIVQGSFKETWLPTSDRINEIEGRFYSAAEAFKERALRIYDTQALSQGRAQRTTSIDLKGITNEQQAWEQMTLMLNMNRYILRSIEFQATLDAINCTVGDVFYLQHDVPAWGNGGKLEAGSTTSLIYLDQEVTFEPGKQYKILVHFSSVTVMSGTVGAVSTIPGEQTVVNISGYLGSTVATHIRVAGKDYAIRDAGDGYVVISATDAITTGAAYTMFNTDVPISRDVVNLYGVTTRTSGVTVTMPFPSAPDQYSNFMFGETTKVAKPFRLKAISGSSEYVRTLKAVEYNDSVYDPATAKPTPNYSSLTTGVQAATISGTEERLEKTVNGFKTLVTVRFNSTQQTYVKSKVYVSREGAPFVYVGEGSNAVTMEAIDKEVLKFKVVAMDVFGNPAAYQTAPTVIHTVVGKSKPPANVLNFMQTPDKFGIRLTWTAVSDIDLDGYEIRLGGTTWETASRIFYIKGTEYLWPMQVAGTYKLWIKAKDTSGNYSTTAASTTATITVPTSPIVSYALVGSDEIISWSVPSAQFSIDYYEVRYGTVWDTATPVATVKGNTLRRKVTFNGTRRYMVAAIDIADNVGTPGLKDVTISVPGAVTTKPAQVIDNNVLLYWSKPTTGSLPIDYYEIRRGDTYVTADVLGIVSQATFSTVFEQKGGSYRYWITPTDTAGFDGPQASIVATVNEPPDFVLRLDYTSTLSGTRVNMALENGFLQGPFNTSETWDTHFSSRAYTSPQSQIDAGFPLYLQPNTTSGTYEEIIDTFTGAEDPTKKLSASTVTVSLNTTSISAGVTNTCQIYYRKIATLPGTTNWTNGSATVTGTGTSFNTLLAPGDVLLAPNGTVVTVLSIASATSLTLTANYAGATISGQTTTMPWTMATPGFSALALNFRYVRVMLTFTASNTTALVQVNSMSIKLANKLKTDSGTFTITNATTGVFVPFNIAFADADTPVCQATGGTALIPIVDFADVANPTGFTVYLYNPATGIKVTGSGAWTARGYA